MVLRPDNCFKFNNQEEESRAEGRRGRRYAECKRYAQWSSRNSLDPSLSACLNVDRSVVKFDQAEAKHSEGWISGSYSAKHCVTESLVSAGRRMKYRGEPPRFGLRAVTTPTHSEDYISQAVLRVEMMGWPTP
jgi:hypothetical protein